MGSGGEEVIKILFPRILDHLSESKKRIMLTYPFVKLFMAGNLEPSIFLDDLKSFEEDLIKKGISKQEIESIKNFAFKEATNRKVFAEINSFRQKSLNSPQDWKNYWRIVGKYDKTKWYEEKEIRVYRMPNVNASVLPIVISGIKELLDELGLDFDIRNFGTHPSIIQQVNLSTMTDGKLNTSKLFLIQFDEDWRKNEKGGKQHADVVIVNQYLADSDSFWGGTIFQYGGMAISVLNQRQRNLNFIKNVAKHETAHLLGLGYHHDQINVRGYPSVRDCLTFHRCSSLIICQRCRDAIVAFWEGIQEGTGKRFFKRIRIIK
ncbi:hypothetical protein J4448_01060 [Candidatus Woesearchaeota archaeon]|nr:hypothetical protein [Candidatus Woesearchaeota archaeon]